MRATEAVICQTFSINTRMFSVCVTCQHVHNGTTQQQNVHNGTTQEQLVKNGTTQQRHVQNGTKQQQHF
jgi:hypothetical protein